MKKILVFTLSLVTVTTVLAQKFPHASSNVNLNTNVIDSHGAKKRPIHNNDRAAGDIIWSNDFSIPSDWTATGPSTNYTQNGWSIGTTTNGWFFPNTGDMGTTGNFARFVNGDPSVAGDVIQNGPFTLEYSTPINLTGFPAPIIEFSQYGARFITLQAVEVSTNGGVTWVEVGNNTSITPLTANGGAVYGQPEIRQFSIGSAIASNPANVTIRFVWDGLPNGGTTNYIEYAWYVDDVKIIEGSKYDAQIEAGKFATDGIEYYMIPTAQLTGIELSGEVFNGGDSVHTGLNLEATVNKGAVVYSGTSTDIDLLPYTRDTLEATTLYTPANGLGKYDITWTFLGDNPDDIAAGNDTIVDSIEVTSTTYARDNGIETNLISNFAGNGGQVFKIGNLMRTYGNGYMNRLEVKISDNTDNVGQFIYGSVYKLINGTFVEVQLTGNHQIVNADLDNFISLKLIDPVEVQAGDEFIIFASHYGGANDVEFGMAQPTYFGSVLGIPATGQLASLTNPRAIMIRVEMTESITVNQDIEICDGETYSIGSSTYSSSGVFTDVLTTVVNGNDSIVNTNLTVLQSDYDTINVDICFGDFHTVGGINYSISGFYNDTLQSVINGCDSIVTTNLQVDQPINTAVTINQYTLSASINNALYQWVDCDANYQVIAGATAQTYSPQQNGSYAVIISSNGCSDTSECESIIGLRLEEYDYFDFSIYPNPTKNSIIIAFNQNETKTYFVRILNQLGQTVRDYEQINNQQHQINDLNLQSGIYYIELTTESKRHLEKLLIHD